ncbi:unnamed protein product [Microthlaspi erraticum]|uniref:Uncharacterized protein n=1 Tax=Microthlaspi erraticum TaxID=1685480 RepID=A0A6D2HKH3_9BRAS|nr:unnamed protein product [Microthlaspi erraticum]
MQVHHHPQRTNHVQLPSSLENGPMGRCHSIQVDGDGRSSCRRASTPLVACRGEVSRSEALRRHLELPKNLYKGPFSLHMNSHQKQERKRDKVERERRERPREKGGEEEEDGEEGDPEADQARARAGNLCEVVTGNLLEREVMPSDLLCCEVVSGNLRGRLCWQISFVCKIVMGKLRGRLCRQILFMQVHRDVSVVRL